MSMYYKQNTHTAYLHVAITYICQTIQLLLKDSYPPKAFSISRALSKSAHMRTKIHGCLIIDDLNLCASSRNISLHSTIEIADNWRLDRVRLAATANQVW